MPVARFTSRPKVIVNGVVITVQLPPHVVISAIAFIIDLVAVYRLG